MICSFIQEPFVGIYSVQYLLSTINGQITQICKITAALTESNSAQERVVHHEETVVCHERCLLSAKGIQIHRLSPSEF